MGEAPAVVRNSRNRQRTSNSLNRNRQPGGFVSDDAAINKQNPFPNIPKPERPKISVDSIHVLNDDLKYRLANMFFSELNVPDSAKFYYEEIIDNDKNKKVVPQATYALGTYYLTLNQEEPADSIFKIVYEKYPELDIAKDAAKRLKIEYVSDDDPALKLFLNSEEKYLDSSFSDAINGYKKLTVDYPESPLAPKALYTIGFIYENDLNLSDSAAVIYDSLSAQYGNSEYSRAVKPQLQEYKNKLQKAQKALADSLAADSLSADSSAVIPDNQKIQQEQQQPVRKDSAGVKQALDTNQNLKEKVLPDLKKAIDKKKKPQPIKKKAPKN